MSQKLSQSYCIFLKFDSACVSSNDARGKISQIKLINNKTWAHNGKMNYTRISMKKFCKKFETLVGRTKEGHFEQDEP